MPKRIWHVCLTVGGEPRPVEEVLAALERFAEERPFLLEGRYADDAAEIRYWEEAPSCEDAAALALRVWSEHRASAGLPPGRCRAWRCSSSRWCSGAASAPRRACSPPCSATRACGRRTRRAADRPGPADTLRPMSSSTLPDAYDPGARRRPRAGPGGGPARRRRGGGAPACRPCRPRTPPCRRWPTPWSPRRTRSGRRTPRDVAAARREGTAGGDDRPAGPRRGPDRGDGGRAAPRGGAARPGGRGGPRLDPAERARRCGRCGCPLGVVGIVYEARPNVTADAAGLCLKSGNAVLLRGSASAYRTQRGRWCGCSSAAVASVGPAGGLRAARARHRPGVGDRADAGPGPGRRARPARRRRADPGRRARLAGTGDRDRASATATSTSTPPPTRRWRCRSC